MEITFKGKDFDIKQHFEDCGKSKNTCNTYQSMIRKALKLLNTNKIDDLVEKPQEMIAILKDMNNNSAKTILSALVVLLDDLDKDTAEIYRDSMMKKIKKHEEEQEEQKMSEKQEKNWMSWEEVLNVYEKTAKTAKTLLTSGAKLNPKELQIVQNWVILSLYTKIPPRRIQDYTLLLWNPTKDDGDKTDNYIDFKKKQLVFNQYKTSGKYGTERIDIPKELMTVLNKWKTLKPEGQDYVLFNSAGKNLAGSELTIKLNKVFGKNVSASMLRHIYLSEMYKDVPALKKMKDTAREMGHSVEMALKYVKKS